MRYIDLICLAWFVWLRCMVITNLAKVLLSKGEIGDADFDRFESRNNENSFKDQSYIPRRGYYD